MTVHEHGHVSQVLRTAAEGPRPEHRWSAVHERIAVERTQVDEAIDEGMEAYGFTTLLGHLADGAMPPGRDDYASTQRALLEAHCIDSGVPRVEDRAITRLVAACKAQQLSHGGTGISAEAFAGIIRMLESDDRPIPLPLLYSYSSGDVIPAAWFVRTLLERRHIDMLRRGDLIALLNGNYVSTAVGLLVLLQWSRISRRFVRLQRQTRDRLVIEPRLLPISLRDLDPIVRQIRTGTRDLVDRLEWRLSVASGNPLFRSGDSGRVEVDSQSSFLDFGLTQSLEQISGSVLTLSHLSQRALTHLCTRLEELEPDVAYRYVQAPKASAALLAQARLRITTTPLALLSDSSNGIEDLWDLSLPTALRLLDTLSLLQLQHRLLEDVLRASADLESPPGDPAGPQAHAGGRGSHLDLLEELGLPVEACDRLLSEQGHSVAGGGTHPDP